MTATCRLCLFYFAHHGDDPPHSMSAERAEPVTGYCHWNAPSVRCEPALPMWPEVKRDDWCGQFILRTPGA